MKMNAKVQNIWLQAFVLLMALVMLMNPAASALLTGNGTACAETDVSKVLAGKYISVMGDSISTYTGWSDHYPITDTVCTNRYGEAYYGPAGSDFHNTDLLVTDTWWHQAAAELGGEILVSNAGNSTGLLYASYPGNLQWQQYLQEMLAYKTRPYHMGRDGKTPDVIALYIGSSDLTRVPVSGFGSIDDVDFATLIRGSGGDYTYAEPTTVAEAYCILLHKLTQTYPNAEIYCFGVVPSAGGTLATCNKRLKPVAPFNEMIRGVADYFGAITVDLMGAFQLDPNNDGVASQADFDAFQSCYNNDPHPNAKGFDVITGAFVAAFKENSRYMTQVETTAGGYEDVGLDAEVTEAGGVQTVTTSAVNYVTASGMIVNYQGQSRTDVNGDISSTTHYTVADTQGRYKAEGGSDTSTTYPAPVLELEIPLLLLAGTETGESVATGYVEGSGRKTTTTSGDPKTALGDGVYDYTTTTVSEAGSISIKALTASFAAGADERGEGMSYIYNSTMPLADNDLITSYTPVVRPQTAADVPPITKGYDYVYIGSDQMSNFWSSHVYSAPLDSYPDETPVLTNDVTGESYYVGAAHSVFKKRGLMVPRYYLPNQILEGSYPARYDSIQMFIMSNAKAQLATTYCAWQGVSAEKGYSYRMQNVEDVDYFSDEAAQMMRTVARNGYWGTQAGYGSLDAMREMMQNSGKFTQAEVEALTDGIAMTATQYAIWTFSNERDGIRYVNAYYVKKPTSAVNTPADREDADLIMKLYHHLISLEPAEIAPEDMTTYNTIINEHHFLDSASIAVKSKPDTHPNNLDSNPDNDVYMVDLSFKLQVQPMEGNEDHLVMTIMDPNRGVLRAVCLAGVAGEGETRLYPDGNKVYTVRNVLLEEGQMCLCFSLDGIQNLGQDVYLYNSEVRDGEPSQTMVGIAAGKRSVDVSMQLGLEIAVTDDVCTIERVWRTEEVVPVPTSTPAIDVPDTGDYTGIEMWILLLGISMVMMAGFAVANYRMKER